MLDGDDKMAGWSQSDGSKDNITQTISPITTSGTAAGQSNEFEATSLFENKDLDTLRNLISTLTSSYKTQAAQKQSGQQALTALIQNLMSPYSKTNAMEDAKGLMALNVQNALEKGTPAIARSIESAGTSASSMQALLSQKLATDSALSASALGANQAIQYGNILANLAALLQKNNADTQDTQTLGGLINALQILKGGVSTSSKSGSTSSTSNKTQGEYSINRSVGDTNNASPFTIVSGSSRATGDTLLDLAAQYGYAGDLRGSSYSTSGQSIYDYTQSNDTLGEW